MSTIRYTDGARVTRVTLRSANGNRTCAAFYDSDGRLLDLVEGWGEHGQDDLASHIGYLLGSPMGVDIVTGRQR